MFKKLIEHPAYIFKFAIYILFIGFAVIFYFSGLMEGEEDSNLKNISSALLLIYGTYRLIRTSQDFKSEFKHED